MYPLPFLTCVPSVNGDRRGEGSECYPSHSVHVVSSSLTVRRRKRRRGRRNEGGRIANVLSGDPCERNVKDFQTVIFLLVLIHM